MTRRVMFIRRAASRNLLPRSLISSLFVELAHCVWAPSSSLFSLGKYGGGGVRHEDSQDWRSYITEYVPI